MELVELTVGVWDGTIQNLITGQRYEFDVETELFIIVAVTPTWDTVMSLNQFLEGLESREGVSRDCATRN